MASGVTNAWLLEAHDTYARVHMVAATKATSALGPRHENVHANMDDNHAAADGFKAPCQKFCSDESKVMAKQRFDLKKSHSSQAPLFIVLWVVPEWSGHTSVRADSTLPLPLPLRVRYSRMTL